MTDQDEPPSPTETSALLPAALPLPNTTPDTHSAQSPQSRSHPQSRLAQHTKNIPPSHFIRLLLTILTVYTLVYFDSFFLSSAHPTITSSFHSSTSAPWLSTSFYLTSTLTGPLYGRLSDIIGRKPVYFFCIALFTVSTAWCGSAKSIGSFIAARAACGAGAGGMIVLSNILLSDTVRVEYRGIYQSYLNIAFGAGNGLGASLGGVIVDFVGWRMAFWAQVPLLVGLGAWSFWAVPVDLGPRTAEREGKGIWEGMKGFDFKGAVCLSVCLAGLILGLNLGGSILSWGHPVVIVSLVACVVAGVMLVFAEEKAERPLLPIRLLRQPPIANLNWGNLIGAALSSLVLFNVPLFLQGVKQVSPTQSGLVLLSPLVGLSIFSISSGFIISATRKIKVFMTLGVSSMLVGMVACSLLKEWMPIWLVMVTIPFVSIGQGLFFPVTTVSTLAISSDEDQAVVVTTLSLARNVGTVLGVAISSWILQNALVLFLDREVSGPNKEKIIKNVRKSVKAIGHLHGKHKAEVIVAFSLSLRTMFVCCALLAIILCALILPIQVPDLQAEEDLDKNDEVA